MSRNKEISAEYAEELKDYAEKLNFFSNFAGEVTLSSQEHKMLIEGYKSKFMKSKLFKEFERADLTDYFLWERSNGGTNL